MNGTIQTYQHVIGLTGPIASGKGLAVKAIRNALGDTKIHSVLLSDFIRNAVRMQGDPLNRDTLRLAGNAKRTLEGPGAWARLMLSQLTEKKADVLVVDSIRNPGEIEALQEAFGSRLYIIATDAPVEDRIARVLQRARQDDSTNPEEIERAMRIEMEDNPEFGFAIERCRDMADFVSLGKESKEERMREIQEAVREFLERELFQEAYREMGQRKVA